MVEQGPNFIDHCGFKGQNEVVDKLSTERNGNCFVINRFEENVVFSCKVLKFNRFNMRQERDLLVTNIYVYNIKSKSKSTFVETGS